MKLTKNQVDELVRVIENNYINRTTSDIYKSGWNGAMDEAVKLIKAFGSEE